MIDVILKFLFLMLAFTFVISCKSKYNSKSTTWNIENADNEIETINPEILDTIDYKPKELREPLAEITYNPADISFSQEFGYTVMISSAEELHSAI